MGETVLMIGLQRTVYEADVIRDQLKITTYRAADRRQAAEIPVDRETLQSDGIRPEILPETGTPGRIHLGINSDSYLELGETTFNQFQQKRGGYGDPVLPGVCPFEVAKTGAVQQIIEGNAMLIEQADVMSQI